MNSGDSKTSWISKASTLITIACTLIGTAVGYFTLAAAVNWPPFRESAVSRQVNVFKGDGCSDGNNCAHIGVQIKGFAPDTEVICHYESSVGSGGFTSEILRTGSDGSASKVSTNRFWDPSGNGWVAVTCNDVRGILQRW